MPSEQEARDLKRRHAAHLLGQPGVCGVGVEKDESGGYVVAVHLDSDDPAVRQRLPHHLVGAIADRRLANKPVADKIDGLLDGLTLEEAAVLPDLIKDWDRKHLDDDPSTFHLAAPPSIKDQLLAFWKANPPNNQDPSK